MSDISKQPSLFYHLGVRESFDMANNVILYHDTDADTAQSLKVRSSLHNLLHFRNIFIPDPTDVCGFLKLTFNVIPDSCIIKSC